jgi:hypothetical protein
MCFTSRVSGTEYYRTASEWSIPLGRRRAAAIRCLDPEGPAGDSGSESRLIPRPTLFQPIRENHSPRADTVLTSSLPVSYHGFTGPNANKIVAHGLH